jgi:hypothetical protein
VSAKGGFKWLAQGVRVAGRRFAKDFNGIHAVTTGEQTPDAFGLRRRAANVDATIFFTKLIGQTVGQCRWRETVRRNGPGFSDCGSPLRFVDFDRDVAGFNCFRV